MSTFLSTSKVPCILFLTTLYRILFSTLNGCQGQHYRCSSPELEHDFHPLSGLLTYRAAKYRVTLGCTAVRNSDAALASLPAKTPLQSCARTTSTLHKAGSGYGTYHIPHFASPTVEWSGTYLMSGVGL
ncbi:hypothetical protein PspLS_07398 [Pyricularia sp. CBS 133598]|nr:hypothetical protein PspLS_07398 [Pyricularia sp. CBS 133598]